MSHGLEVTAADSHFILDGMYTKLRKVAKINLKFWNKKIIN